MSGCEVDFDDLRKKCREFPRGVTISSDGYDSRMLNRHEDEGMVISYTFWLEIKIIRFSILQRFRFKGCQFK